MQAGQRVGGSDCALQRVQLPRDCGNLGSCTPSHGLWTVRAWGLSSFVYTAMSELGPVMNY